MAGEIRGDMGRASPTIAHVEDEVWGAKVLGPVGKRGLERTNPICGSNAGRFGNHWNPIMTVLQMSSTDEGLCSVTSDSMIQVGVQIWLPRETTS